MPVKYHWSCIVITTGFPEAIIRSKSLNERKPWLTQCRWIISAWRNTSIRVMSVPALAISTWNRLRLLSPLASQMTPRSHRKLARSLHDGSILVTLGESVLRSRTSIVASTPLWFKACNRRLAAMAAPPVRSAVLTIRMRILLGKVSKSYHHVSYIRVLFLVKSEKQGVSHAENPLSRKYEICFIISGWMR